MGKTVLSVAKLLVVQQLQQGPDGAAVQFKDGPSGRLPRAHERYPRWEKLLQDSFQHQRPVGASLADGGSVLDVRWADQDVVKWFDGAEAEPVRISFRGHAGVYHLFHEHPDFARTYAAAKRSAEHAEMVWFISSGSPLVLLDLVLSKDLPEPIYPKPNGVAS